MGREHPESNRILLGTGNLLVARLGGIALLWLADLVIARSYGADGSGQFYVWWTLASALTILSLLGLGDLLVRDVSLLDSGQGPSHSIDYGRLVGLVAAVSTGLSTVLVVAAFWTGQGLGAVAIAASIFPFALSILHMQLLRAVGRPVSGAVMNNVAPSLVFVLLVLVVPPDSFAVLGVAFFVSKLLGLLLIGAAWLRQFGWAVAPRDAGQVQWRSRLRSGRRLLIAQLSEYALSWSDLLLVALFLGPAATGVYAIAGRIAVSVNLVQESINARSGPAIARLLANDQAQAASALARSLSMKGAMLISLPILGLIVLREPILGIFGEEFRAGSTVLVMLLVAQAAQVVGGPFRTLLSMSHRESALARAFVLAIVVNVVLNLILIPRYGIEGAAAATLVALWLRNGLILLNVRVGLVSSG